jgi:hypothetical protein
MALLHHEKETEVGFFFARKLNILMEAQFPREPFVPFLLISDESLIRVHWYKRKEDVARGAKDGF